jgi:hypothetical protein
MYAKFYVGEELTELDLFKLSDEQRHMLTNVLSHEYSPEFGFLDGYYEPEKNRFNVVFRDHEVDDGMPVIPLPEDWIEMYTDVYLQITPYQVDEENELPGVMYVKLTLASEERCD